MHRPMRPLSPRLVTLATVAAAAVLASTSACELFGVVACEEDEDCPASLPFCVEDLCAAEADDGRSGRGIDGEGEGESEGCTAATEADDCPGGLCDEDGAFVEAGACLPPPGTDDCSNEASFSAAPRAAAGPVMFALSYSPLGDGCYANVTFTAFDRQGDVSQTSPLVFLLSGGTGVPVEGAFSEDGTTFTIGTLCGAAADGVSGLQVFDALEQPSNTLCLRPEGVPAP